MKTTANSNPLKEQSIPGTLMRNCNGVPLRSVVNRLVSNLLPIAMEQQSVIVNEVPGHVKIAAHDAQTVRVISELLTTVVANSKKGIIHIHAERLGELVVFSIRDSNNYNGYALSFSIQSITPMAAMAGGYLSMEGLQQLETTISFSFPVRFS